MTAQALLGLEGNVALVVGGGGPGLGGAYSLALAQAGCDIVISDFGDNVQPQVDAVLATGRRCVVVKADATTAEGADESVRKAYEAFGRLDVAVNNVGGPFGFGQSVLDFSIEDWDRTMDVNLKSAFLGSKAQIKAMIEHDTLGRIITVSAGTGGLWPSFPAGIAAYGAANAGVVNFTQSLAVEFAKYGIRANCVIPGTHNDGYNAELGSGGGGHFKMGHHSDASLFRRLGLHWETAGVVVFLASRLSSFVTGQAIASDGGQGLTLHRPQRDPLPRALEKSGKLPHFLPEPSQLFPDAK